MWSFTASLHSDVWGPERSELTVTGGAKRQPDDSSEFLIWEMAHELQSGDRIAFSFEEGATSSPQGTVFVNKTSPESEKINFFGPVPEEEMERLENKPMLNLKCSWRFILNQGEPEISAAVDETRQSLSLHILWNEMRPELMRVSLSKSSLREITDRIGGKELFLRYVELGASVEVTVET